jgi:ribosomal protein L37AE/L43A
MEPETAEMTLGRRRAGEPCPKCGALRVHRSHRRGLAERVLAAAGRGGIRRCHACEARFARVGGSIVYVADARSAMLRFALLAAGASVAAALIARWL